MRHVSLLLYPQGLSSSVGLSLEMLHATNELLRRRRQREAVEVQLVGLDGAPVTMMGGVQLLPSTPFAAVERTDLIILPALWRDPLALAKRTPALLTWLQRQWGDGCRLVSAGSASFLLAEAGLLRGQPATTHWYYFERFAQRYPEVVLKRDHLITKSGRIFCVGSVNALADMLVQLIRDTFGSAIAAAVECQFSPEIRQSTQERMFDPERSNPHSDDAIVALQEWLHRHYEQEISMVKLAARFGMTVRTLHRRLKAACGQSPSDYLAQIRIENAKALLKGSNLSITEIAHHVGYSSAGHFAVVFRRHTGATPTLYRTQVRKKLFSDPRPGQEG